MTRQISILAALLAATAAHAADERIAITGAEPAVAQLRESLCISEQCVGQHEKVVAVVHAREAKGGQLEVQLRSPEGAVRYSKKVSVTEEGRISSMDLASASAGIIQAIENGGDAKAEAKAPEAKAEKKSKKLAKAEKKAKAKKLAAKKSKGVARG